MASDEDNFDIDVYGDGEEDKTDQAVELSAHELPADGVDDGVGQSVGQGADYKSNGDDVGSKPQPTDKQIANVENANDGVLGGTGHVGAQSAAAEIKRESPEHVKPGQLATPKTDPPKQGIKRKESPDDRPIDSGATSALVVTDLNWWNTDDELRGWTKKAECEQELKDVTFSEHKVNGKSKGYGPAGELLRGCRTLTDAAGKPTSSSSPRRLPLRPRGRSKRWPRISNPRSSPSRLRRAPSIHIAPSPRTPRCAARTDSGTKTTEPLLAAT